MKKILKTLVTFIIILSVVSIISYATTQQELKEEQERLKQIQQQLKDIQKKIDKNEVELSTTMQKLSQLQDNIYLQEEKIGALEQEINIYNLQRDNKQLEIDDLTEKIEIRQQEMSARISVMYKTDSLDYMQVIMNASDFSDFLKRTELMSGILIYDKEKLEALNADKERLVLAFNELETIITGLNSSKDELVVTKNRLEDDKNKVVTYQNQLRTEITNAQAGIELLEQQEKESEKEIADKLEEIKAEGGTNFGDGIYTWPVPSSHRITSGFGNRIHPIYGTVRFHAGIDIGAPTGTTIVAADDGEVIKVVNVDRGGYGKYLIIYHGDTMTTQYAHCSKIYVKEGDIVTQGQSIAEIGSTGASTGPHLHFEVRKNNVVQNPINYVSN